MLTLTIQNRNTDEVTTALRTQNRMPAVYYGRKTDSNPISIYIPDFKKTWEEAGESTVITLVDENDEEHGALIQDVQVHPVTNEPLHADFYIFAKGQKVTVDVPLEFVGESPAVKNQGGMLVKVMHSVNIEAEPANLPQSIEVDISTLEEFEDAISVGELSTPDGVEIIDESDETVALVSEPVEEEEFEDDIAADVDFEEMIEVAGEEVEGEEGVAEEADEVEPGEAADEPEEA